MAIDEPLLFPPLPKMPEPPVVGPDPRQTVFQGIVGALSDATRGRVQATNTTTGFPASAPSLGEIKDAHERALTRFDMGVVQDRWDKDVGDWLRESLVRWIQRTKSLSTDLRPKGIAVEIETQDDHGYYRYSFDLMLREAPANRQ